MSAVLDAPHPASHFLPCLILKTLNTEGFILKKMTLEKLEKG